MSVKQRCQRSKIFGAEALPLALSLKRMAHEADGSKKGEKSIASGDDWAKSPLKVTALLPIAPFQCRKKAPG